MSEASRHRYLFLKNRLEELFAKYGPPEVSAMPDWLDSLEGFKEHAADELLALSLSEDVVPAPPQPAQNHALSASEAMSRLDRYGETPLFACPVCGEDSAKASVPLDLWRCTQCRTNGKASSLTPRPGFKATPEHLA